MKRALFGIIFLLTAPAVQSDEGNNLKSELAPLQFLVGWCWAGKFPDGKRTDIHCFEPVYNGAHLRDRHVVVGGPDLYEGETIYSWSENAGGITYVYWNSFGGFSTGTATPDDETIVFPDETYTGSDGETVIISSVWKNMTDDSYDSFLVESFATGEKKERRIRYEKRPFVMNPEDAK